MFVGVSTTEHSLYYRQLFNADVLTCNGYLWESEIIGKNILPVDKNDEIYLIVSTLHYVSPFAIDPTINFVLYFYVQMERI